MACAVVCSVAQRNHLASIGREPVSQEGCPSREPLIQPASARAFRANTPPFRVGVRISSDKLPVNKGNGTYGAPLVRWFFLMCRLEIKKVCDEPIVGSVVAACRYDLIHGGWPGAYSQDGRRTLQYVPGMEIPTFDILDSSSAAVRL